MALSRIHTSSFMVILGLTDVMRPVDCPAADPAPPFLRMERKGDPGGGRNRHLGRGRGHAREPQSCHRPRMLRLLHAAAPHRFQPRTLHPPEV